MGLVPFRPPLHGRRPDASHQRIDVIEIARIKRARTLTSPESVGVPAGSKRQSSSAVPSGRDMIQPTSGEDAALLLPTPLACSENRREVQRDGWREPGRAHLLSGPDGRAGQAPLKSDRHHARDFSGWSRAPAHAAPAAFALIVLCLAAAAAAAMLGFLLTLGARDVYLLIRDRSAGARHAQRTRR